MARKRLTMRKIREILRLKNEAGLSNRAIAGACKISNSTVGDYLRRAENAGIGWPLRELEDEELTQKLFPEDQTIQSEPEYPNAILIRVVMDNLGTHKPASRYETFAPHEARRILKKLEFHYTPKHGSWLDMAEIELSIFSRKLKQHIPDETLLKTEVQAIVGERNSVHSIIKWQFRTEDARIKLLHLYPSISA